MSKGVFVVGTDTDVGKTYVTAVLMKKLQLQGVHVGYYKAVLSGGYYEGDQLIPGDAQEVLEATNTYEEYDKCVSYTLEHPYSPHLAAKIEGVEISLEKIKRDYERMANKYEYLCVEGSGGIICPIQVMDSHTILLEDIIKLTGLPTLIVARAGLGTINHTTLTVKYLQQQNIEVQGIVLNGYEQGNIMHESNREMIEMLTGIKVIDTIAKDELAQMVDR